MDTELTTQSTIHAITNSECAAADSTNKLDIQDNGSLISTNNAITIWGGGVALHASGSSIDAGTNTLTFSERCTGSGSEGLGFGGDASAVSAIPMGLDNTELPRITTLQTSLIFDL